MCDHNTKLRKSIRVDKYIIEFKNTLLKGIIKIKIHYNMHSLFLIHI